MNSSSRLRFVLSALVLLGSVAAPGWAANGHVGRLDPDERQRLRGDLRQQAFEERLRMRDERMRARGDAGAYPGGAPGGYAPLRPPGFPPGPGAPAGPAIGSGPYENRGAGPPPAGAISVEPGGPRLIPDERQQLRRQLREARIRGFDNARGP